MEIRPPTFASCSVVQLREAVKAIDHQQMAKKPLSCSLVAIIASGALGFLPARVTLFEAGT